MDDIVRLNIKPHGRLSPARTIRYEARLKGELICTSHQPLFDGARILLAKGYKPDLRLTTRNHGNQYDNFEPVTIGYAAARTCDEFARSFVRYVKYGDATAL